MSDKDDPSSILSSACARLNACLSDRLVAIVAFGGIARDEYIPGWSDIDLLLVVDALDNFILSSCANVRLSVTEEFSTRMDLVLHSRYELELRGSSRALMNSMSLNSLSGRQGTGTLVYGAVELYPANSIAERQAALCYLNDTAYRLRKLFVERRAGEDWVPTLARSIRWISSALRCYLRARGRFHLPYEALVQLISEEFPTLPLETLKKAFNARRQWQALNAGDARDLLLDLQEFWEQFMALYLADKKAHV